MNQPLAAHGLVLANDKQTDADGLALGPQIHAWTTILCFASGFACRPGALGASLVQLLSLAAPSPFTRRGAHYFLKSTAERGL